MLEELNWDNLTIDGDELKEIRGIDIKTFKHKDLQTVCVTEDQGVKNAMKEAIFSG